MRTKYTGLLILTFMALCSCQQKYYVFTDRFGFAGVGNNPKEMIKDDRWYPIHVWRVTKNEADAMHGLFADCCASPAAPKGTYDSVVVIDYHLKKHNRNERITNQGAAEDHR